MSNTNNSNYFQNSNEQHLHQIPENNSFHQNENSTTNGVNRPRSFQQSVNITMPSNARFEVGIQASATQPQYAMRNISSRESITNMVSERGRLRRENEDLKNKVKLFQDLFKDRQKLNEVLNALDRNQQS